jgi:hypothetical protein
MKLALRCAVVGVLCALGVLLWWRRDTGSDGAAPSAARNASAPGEVEQPGLVERSASATISSQARQEVATAPLAETAARETLLRIRVVGLEHRAPIVGLRLTLIPVIFHGSFGSRDVDGARGGPGESPLTDAEGRVEFVVEPGSAYQLHSRDDRFAHADERVEALVANEVRELNIELATEDDLVYCGRIVDAGDSTALPSSQIKLAPANAGESSVKSFPSEAELRRGALSVDTEGRFELRGKSWLMHYAFATADGYSHVVFVVEKGHEVAEHEFEIRLSRVATADVHVRDGRGALDGALVDLSARSHLFQLGSSMRGYYFTEDLHWSATTDATGIAHLVDLPSRVPLTVDLRLPDGKLRRESQELELEPGEHRALEIVIGSGAVVRGRIEERTGKPVADWPVWRVATESSQPRMLEHDDKPAATVLTDADGRFEFDDVPLGLWSIGAAPTNPIMMRGLRGVEISAEFGALAQAVEIRNASEQIDLVQLVDRELYLRGSVVIPDGSRAEQASIVAYMNDADAFVSEPTIGEATFELGPLPAGKWTLFAQDDSRAFAPSEVVRADAGTDGIVLKLRPSGSIHGTVIDARTRALTPCDVCLTTFDPEFRQMPSGAREGAFRFDGLPPGRYLVSVTTEDGRQARRQVEVKPDATSEAVELALEAGAKLVLRYDGSERYCTVTLSVDGVASDVHWLKPGTSATCIVPPRALDLRWQVEDSKIEETQALTLAIGEVREVAWKGKP